METASQTGEDVRYCTQMVRDQANDLYLASLLMPDAIAPEINVLNAFHVEVVNITLGTREPLAGEIRLQWWVEVLNGQRADEAKGHPLARALIGLMQRHDIAAKPFEQKLNAHIFDLYREPMEDRTMFEAWCGETRSTLYQTAGWLAGIEQGPVLSEAAGHAGVATGIINVVQNLYRTRQLGQTFVPVELLNSAGLDQESFCTQWDSRHEMALGALFDMAEEHFSKAKTALNAVGGKNRNVFLPLAMTPLYLKKFDQYKSSLHQSPVSVSQLRKQWCLWRASRMMPFV